MAHLCPIDNTTADASHPRQSRLKAQPTFGWKDASDEENSLPDASMPSVMAYSKRKATGKAVSGKHVGSGPEVKPAPAKEQMRIDSGSEGEVVKRCGRAHGAVNWSDDDFMALLNAVEDVLPAGKKEWVLVYNQFEAWAKEHGHPIHSEATVENRFKVVSHSPLT